jgi:exonuclease III
MSSDPNCVVFNWNVCGLNNPARRQVVRDMVQDHRCTIICLQETKIQSVIDAMVIQTVGSKFSNNHVSLPADGTRGGIFLACSQDHYAIINSTLRPHSVTATLQSKTDNERWTITVVYGPQGDTEKLNFLEANQAFSNYQVGYIK